MIVICEECGKKYRIDPARIKGRAASFKCRACAHQIIVSKPDSSPAKPSIPKPVSDEPAEAKPASEPRSTSESITRTVDDPSATAISAAGSIKPTTAGAAPRPPRKRGRLGLRAKMLMLFFFIPMIFMAGASLFYLWQFESTTDLLTRESSLFVNRLAEEKIADLSVAVAMQCKLYLLSHPELIKENFIKDPGFKSLAVQKVGLTGYTALYQLPGSDGVWQTWAHIDSKIIGIDMSRLKKSLGKNFAGFWKIYTGVKSGKQSQGYYTWQDKDAKFRDKFMVCTPIAGTRFVIAATTYLDEFTGPARMMASNAKKITDKARIVTLAILGATLLLIGLIVSIYGHRLTGKIKTLTEAADLISLGELGREIETQSKDEIGGLAEAIARMQNSIRLLKKSTDTDSKII
jgi:HAMP domain-containing protein